ncbi:hypothetical protein EV363DRAFT_1084001, partial [Boletus edulis]
KAPKPHCPHCPDRRETVQHFLLECLHYEQSRYQLRGKLRERARRIESLLADPACTKHIFKEL